MIFYTNSSIQTSAEHNCPNINIFNSHSGKKYWWKKYLFTSISFYCNIVCDVGLKHNLTTYINFTRRLMNLFSILTRMTRWSHCSCSSSERWKILSHLQAPGTLRNLKPVFFSQHPNCVYRSTLKIDLMSIEMR